MNDRNERRRQMTDRPMGLERPISSVGFWFDHAMVQERARTRLEVRLSHLKNQGRTDADAAELHELVSAVENFVDDRLVEYAFRHPTAPWWRRMPEACQPQTMGKILGHIDDFGRWYRPDDVMVPLETRTRRQEQTDERGEKWIWVKGIERFLTPSKLAKYAGLLPGRQRSTGQEREDNTDFRTILFRWMQFGVMFHDCRYRERYYGYKLWKQKDLEVAGVKILPAPKGRFCGECREEQEVPKDTRLCPVCGTKLGRKEEPPGVIWAGHLDNMARRWTVKLFLNHLWVVYRQAEELSVRAPYPIEKMPEKHATVIDPWKMCDVDELPPLAERKVPGERKRRKMLSRDKSSTRTDAVPGS